MADFKDSVLNGDFPTLDAEIPTTQTDSVDFKKNAIEGEFKELDDKSPVTQNFSTGNLNTRFNVGLTGIGESQYDESIPLALVDNLNSIRASRQGWLDEAGNALAGGVVGGLLTAGETIANILDVPNNLKALSNYFAGDETLNTVEYNFASRGFKDMKESLLNEYLPIYKKDPSKLIDFKDSAFYWEAFRGVVDSALGFGLTGMGAGAAVKAAGTGLRLARLGNYTSTLSKGLNIAGKGLQQGRAGQLTAAYITNFGEGKMMALELYERAEKENLQRYIDNYALNNDGAEPSALELKEFQHDAKVNAGKQANIFMMKNKLFIATDYLQLNRMFKATGIGPTRNLVKQPSIKEFLKSQLSNAPKESLEEIGQNVIQMEGLHQVRQKLADKGYIKADKDLSNMTMGERAVEFALSEQALLEGAMGFFGGPIQYAVTQAPFENNKAKQEHYTSQQVQIEQNKTEVEKVLSNIITSQTIKEDAETTGLEGTESAQDNLTFANLAIRNFALGTTAKLQEEIESLRTEENAEIVDKKLKQLEVLEQDYTANSNVSTGANITALNNKIAYLEDIDKALYKRRKEVEVNINKKLSAYNSISDTNYTIQDIGSKDIDKKPGSISFINDIIESSDYQILNVLKEESKKITKNIISTLENLDTYKNKSNQGIYERYQEIVKSNELTENKIKEVQNLVKQVKGKDIKRELNAYIKDSKEALETAENTEAVEKQGGVEEVVDKKKTQKNNEAINKTVDMFKPADYQEEGEIISAEPDLEQQIDDTTIAEPKSIDEIVSAAEGAISLEEYQERVNKAHETISNIAEPALTEPEVVSNYIDIGELNNQEAPTIDTIVSTNQPVDVKSNIDVKLVFNKVASPKFRDFMASNQDKEGVDVEYIIDRKGTAKTMGVKVIVNGDKDNYTFLFPLQKRPTNIPKGKAAWDSENNLRNQIFDTINKGNRAFGKIKFQYSGEFTTDNIQKPVTNLAEFNNAKEIVDKLMYVNSKGVLFKVKTRKANKQFTATKVVTSTGHIWAGAMFIEVTAPNGKKVPLKLNTRRLNTNEVDLLSSLLIDNVTIKTDEFGTNIKDTPLADNQDYYKLLEQSDIEFLTNKHNSENFTRENVIDHLIYQGEKTSSNTATQLFYKGGELTFGTKKFNGENVEELKLFLTRNKPRAVSLKGLKENKAGYNKFIFDNAIINTDMAIDDKGRIFQSSSKNTADLANRYKTQAIYVDSELTTGKEEKEVKKPLEKPKTPTNLQEITKKKMDKVKENIASSTRLTMSDETFDPNQGKDLGDTEAMKKQLDAQLKKLEDKNCNKK